MSFAWGNSNSNNNNSNNNSSGGGGWDWGGTNSGGSFNWGGSGSGSGSGGGGNNSSGGGNNNSSNNNWGWNNENSNNSNNSNWWGGGGGSSSNGNSSSSSGNNNWNWSSTGSGNQNSGNNNNNNNGSNANNGGFGTWGSNNDKNSPDFNFGGNQNRERGENNPLLDLQALFAQYVSQSPHCRFECVLYNKIPDGTSVNQFQKPPQVRPQVWDAGVKQNPDSKHLVPVAVRGYSQLEERSKLCVAANVAAHETFSKLLNTLAELRLRIVVKMRQQINELKQTQLDLSSRLLVLMREYVTQMYPDTPGIVPTMMHNSGNMAIQRPVVRLLNNEIQLKHILGQVLREWKMEANKYFRMEEIMCTAVGGRNDGMMAAFGGGSVMLSGDPNGGRNGASMGANNAMPNAAIMNKMFESLKAQQSLIHQMTQTITCDMDDLRVIEKTLRTQQ